MQSYAGIGPRVIPDYAVDLCKTVGKEMALLDWTLRTGNAVGADQAFAFGANHKNGRVELYLPWESYNKDFRSIIEHTYSIVSLDNEFLKTTASNCHPAWQLLSQGTKRLLCRTVQCLVGESGVNPVNCVIYFSQEENVGGTGFTIRVAKSFGIQTLNLAKTNVNSIVSFIQTL